MKPKAWISWSSGKDSAWALHVVRRAGDIEIAGALTTVTEIFGRVSMHGVRREILEAQLEAAGLPLVAVEIPYPCPNDIYEARMAVAMVKAKAAGISHMVFGDLFLEDIRTYREAKLKATGISPLFPLWGRDTRLLAEEMIAGGLKARIAVLDPGKVPPALAGAVFDRALLDALPAGTDPCAENGEFHTCVTAGPMFSHALDIGPGEIVERDGFVFADLQLRGSTTAAG